MLLDFEVKSCSRLCAATQRTLEPGDVYFSVLLTEQGELVRHDYGADAWQGEPEECLGWWRSRVPTKEGSTPKLAPTDVMLNLFATLADRPADEEFRYLLGLLLLRRRVLKRQDSFLNDAGREVLMLSCPRRNEVLELVVAEPDAEQAQLLQQRMIDLLYGDEEISEPAEDYTVEKEEQPQSHEEHGE
ncbi:MAG: hypothetical protein MI725_17905 [Pirellulales bacterium]|nr:hypothetical protein [Pirellulales bacterium]